MSNTRIMPKGPGEWGCFTAVILGPATLIVGSFMIHPALGIVLTGCILTIAGVITAVASE
jgi:hypothetical protein